jgi:hypothetical protein
MTRCSEFFQKLPFIWKTGASGRDSVLGHADVITKIPCPPDGVSLLHGGIAIQVALS